MPAGRGHRLQRGEELLVGKLEAGIGQVGLEGGTAGSHDVRDLAPASPAGVQQRHVQAEVDDRAALGSMARHRARARLCLGVRAASAARKVAASGSTKSITVVVPPQAAATVPVPQSSLDVTTPGRHLEVDVRVDPAWNDKHARRVDRLRLRPGAEAAPIAAMVSLRTTTSALRMPAGVTTLPFRMIVSPVIVRTPRERAHRIRWPASAWTGSPGRARCARTAPLRGRTPGWGCLPHRPSKSRRSKNATRQQVPAPPKVRQLVACPARNSGCSSGSSQPG